mmetsp:Transcript_30793/g.52578  ORF Transcript_30793/g.52578 Transcript_30793/m.52578 type:complete len:191 (+) Transcript_30793:284-856(+)
MKHMAAYLMLVIGGNDSPTADDVSNALSSVGVEADSEQLNKLISELEGKDLSEVLASGEELLAKFGSGGGGGGGGKFCEVAKTSIFGLPILTHFVNMLISYQEEEAEEEEQRKKRRKRQKKKLKKHHQLLICSEAAMMATTKHNEKTIKCILNTISMHEKYKEVCMTFTFTIYFDQWQEEKIFAHYWEID